MPTSLSEAQGAALQARVRLIEACPGAGKTHAIVARFVDAATSDGPAAALLSFTNAAVDEAARRCVNVPQATQAPNFVGTFDRFLHRYVLSPAFLRDHAKAPRYVDTWSDLPAAYDTQVRHRNVAGAGLALAYFRADARGDLHYPSDDPAEVPASDRAYVAQLTKAGYLATSLNEVAARKVQQLTSSGIFDSEHSRLKATSILRDPSASWLQQRLASRFGEIIVDEFQDCSTIEHEILGSLAVLGIRIVVVADPDQAIYEFRQAEPSSYLNYCQGLPEDAIVYLDENWRSSPAICALASSLRSISTRPILSRRDPTRSPHADVVYVAAGTPEHARSQFDRLATDLGIDAGERLVLAATRRAASALSGRAPNTGTGSTLTSQIMRSVATLRYSRDGGDRKAALSTIEGIVLGSIKFPDDLQRARRQEQLAAAGLDQMQLRMMAAHLVTASESWTDLDVAVNSIRESVRMSLCSSTIEHVPTGQRFKSIKNSDWRAWTRAGQAPRQTLDIAGTHIHSVKGAERDAVLLDIEDEPIGPRPHVVRLWAARETHEARRVLYVGASRARRLLVLAVPPRHLDALREVLERSAVPTEFLVENT